MGQNVTSLHGRKHHEIVNKNENKKRIDENNILVKYGYDINWQKTIGEGSYAKVKGGFSRKTNRAIAVKIVQQPCSIDSDGKEYHPRELSILTRLNHPNIANCEEIIQLNSKVYMIMDLATEGDLLEYIRRHKYITEISARRIFKQLLSAVNYLHCLGIVHRDLKCENVLLYKGITPKITDFGFAKFKSDLNELSKTYCGSAGYAAYEVLKGWPYNGVKSDIWSLGVILYVMVTGTMPYDDANRQTLLRDMSKDLRFSTFHQKISAEVKDLLRNILDKNARSRLSIQQIKEHPWLDYDVIETDLNACDDDGASCKMKSKTRKISHC